MKSNHSRTYPLLICAIVLLFLGFTGWSIYRAVESDPEVLDPDYYSRGLRYNQTLLEQKAATSLGWRLNSRLQGRRLTVELKDAGEKPVRQAHVYLRPAGPPVFPPLSLVETRPGHYSTQLPGTLSGNVRARLELEHQGARLTRALLLAVGHE